jgi:hypothetical protein
MFGATKFRCKSTVEPVIGGVSVAESVTLMVVNGEWMDGRGYFSSFASYHDLLLVRILRRTRSSRQKKPSKSKRKGVTEVHVPQDLANSNKTVSR